MLEELSGVEALGLIILMVKVYRIIEKENYSLEIFPCPFDLLQVKLRYGHLEHWFLLLKKRPRLSIVPDHMKIPAHGLIIYKDTKAKCRHLKKLTCKGTLQQVFICLRPLLS
jgi:hypothetical protein